MEYAFKVARPTNAALFISVELNVLNFHYHNREVNNTIMIVRKSVQHGVNEISMNVRSRDAVGP